MRRFDRILILIVLTFTTGCVKPKAPILSPATDVVSVPTVQAKVDYLEGCRKTYPKKFEQQIGYGNIYPGKSTKQSVEDNLGVPEKIIIIDENHEEYIYNETKLGIFFDQDRVSLIILSDTSKRFRPLEFYLINYGCPDIVFAFDDNQHPTSDYKTLLFVYHKNGMTLMFEPFPVSLSDSPFWINFYPPSTLVDFLGEREYFNDPNKTTTVLWDDVIVE